MIKAGLVVEGGGMRGVYSSGVLDFFIGIESDIPPSKYSLSFIFTF